mgnify:CR=1 FL=1
MPYVAVRLEKATFLKYTYEANCGQNSQCVWTICDGKNSIIRPKIVLLSAVDFGPLIVPYVVVRLKKATYL